METSEFEIKKNIRTFFMSTDKVPYGIPALFNEIEERLGLDKYHVYGVSECVGNKLIYRACLKETYKGEGKDFNLPYYDILKGHYIATTLKNWRDNLPEMPKIFDELLQHPNVKPGSICLEDYTAADEMLLMVQHK